MTRAARLDLTLAALLIVGGLWLAPLATRAAPAVFLNFGPNDQDYVTNFRSDWEPEGRTRFHWTLPQARVELPLLVRGEGYRLRLRARRHFVEPAHVTLRVEGRVVARFAIQAQQDVGWRVLDFALPALEGRQPFVLDIDAPSSNPRPLGVALDWLELERGSASGSIELLEATRTRLLLVLLACFAGLRLAGLTGRVAFGATAGLGLALAAGLARDPLAVERIVREGAAAFIAVAALAAVTVRLAPIQQVLRLTGRPPWVPGALAALVLASLALRLTLLLHPQFYYPDVRIHAVFARELAKTGLVAFLENFTANQYRFSLGLQFENGHWYAFPYPPAFYMLCWPLLRIARYAPESAVAILAAVVNSLEALLLFAIARRTSARLAIAVLAAASVPLLPIFMTRLSLAYFPALVGHAVDALVVLFLLSRLARLSEARVTLALAGLICAALLTYTQSLLNLGLLLPLLLVAWVMAERGPKARRGQLGLTAAGVLGALLSLAFYGRYVPIFLDMQRGVPLAQEQILRDKLERAQRAAIDAPAISDDEANPDDPFAAPTLDLTRGVRKALWRLYVFYGVFGAAILVGIGLAARHAPDRDTRRFVVVWALVYLLLNLASGGLPGPNLVRYNKDLEVVAPLFCIALAEVTLALWDRWRGAGIAFGVAYQAFAAGRALHALTDKFFAAR